MKTMNREEFKAKLDNLKINKSDFCILSGGSLLIQGLREKTNDVDMAMKSEIAKEIGLYDCPTDEHGLYILEENVQCSDDFEKHDKVLVDGIWCQSLESVLAFKKSMNRPKDQADLEAIEDRLKLNNGE